MHTLRRPAALGIAAIAGLGLVVPATAGATSKATSSKSSKAASSKTAATRDIVDTAVANGKFKTLAAALTAADLVKTLKGTGPFTVFAPTDAAFAALPKGTLDALLKDKARLTQVLTYHVVPGRVPAAQVTKLKTAKTVAGADVRIATQGRTVRVNDARVVTADVRARNGIIHVIDKVLLPPAAPAPAPAPAPAMKDIVDTAVGAGSFTTLAAALQAANLVDTLKGAGPFTVFAPTDAAFAALPAGTVDALLKDIPKLTSILTYHVVPGKVMAADVVKLTSAKTVNGAEIQVKVDGKTVMINDAKVTTADVAASNGVIHVIDKVILPPGA